MTSDKQSCSQQKATASKPVIAVDVDEVLAQFIAPCNQFHNQTYNTDFKVEDYKSYNFCETWGCSDAEAIERVYNFMSSELMRDLPVVPGAVEGVARLARSFRLVVVTSRQSFLRDLTNAWLERHFGKDKFEAVLFGNQWLRFDDESVKYTKAELCKSVQAVALIDDLPKYILEVTTPPTDASINAHPQPANLLQMASRNARSGDDKEKDSPSDATTLPTSGTSTMSLSSTSTTTSAQSKMTSLPINSLGAQATSTCQLGVLFNRDNQQKWSVIAPDIPVPQNCALCSTWNEVCQTLEEFPFSHIDPPSLQLTPSPLQPDLSPTQNSTTVQS